MRELLHWAQAQIDAIEADDRYTSRVFPTVSLIRLRAQMRVLIPLREEIRNHLVSRWHEDCSSDAEIYAYMEMTEAEYAAWVEGAEG